MKKILAALAITAVFASCKKETVTGPAPEPASGKKVKQINYSDNTGYTETETIGYDAKGRMLTYTDDDRIYNFSYESDTRLVVTSVKKSDNTPSTTYECMLNNKGAITEMVFKNTAGVVYYTYKFTYDANNQMTKEEGLFPTRQDHELVAEIVNGNIVSQKLFRDGQQASTTILSYDGAKTNKNAGTLFNYWPSLTLFGKSHAFLITEAKTMNMSSTITWHTKSSYELDADGYVTKCTTNYLTDGSTDFTTYQY